MQYCDFANNTPRSSKTKQASRDLSAVAELLGESSFDSHFTIILTNRTKSVH